MIRISICRYLRPQKAYEPPQNVSKMVDTLKSEFNLKTGCNGSQFNLEDKFNFLSLCGKEFNHTVPSSVLHEINTIRNAIDHIFLIWFQVRKLNADIFVILDDVIEFYKTPVKTILPLDELRARELPPNLHIEHKYTRFNPETDTMFGGKTAFPGSSTIVTGIKYRKKYAGFKAERKREELHEDWTLGH